MPRTPELGQQGLWAMVSTPVSMLSVHLHPFLPPSNSPPAGCCTQDIPEGPSRNAGQKQRAGSPAGPWEEGGGMRVA